MANQNVTQLAHQTGSADISSLFYAVKGGVYNTAVPLGVLFNNVNLTGTPTVPTANPGTNTTQIASCAFVQTTAGLYAPLAGATFTGTVTVNSPSQLVSNNVSFTGGSISGTTIAGGSIQNTAIGSLTPSSGAFTTLSTTGLATLNSVSTSSATITGGTVNGTTVGATTPSTGAFTTLSASTNLAVNGSANNLTFTGAATGSRPSVVVSGTDTNIGLTVQVKGATTYHIGNTTGDWITMTGPATAANQVQLAGGATGTQVAVSAIGSDTNINLNLAAKGSGIITSSGPVALSPGYTVATLPSASAALKGAKAYVTDATSPTFLGTLTGGGTVVCPVFCNGTAWVAG